MGQRTSVQDASGYKTSVYWHQRDQKKLTSTYLNNVCIIHAYIIWYNIYTYCLKATYEHVFVQLQRSKFQLLVNCFMCRMPVANPGLQDLTENSAIHCCSESFIWMKETWEHVPVQWQLFFDLCIYIHINARIINTCICVYPPLT